MPVDLRVLTQRPDLLATECLQVKTSRIKWAGRLAELGDYGRYGGGSASDRRRVVEAMVAIERGEVIHLPADQTEVVSSAPVASSPSTREEGIHHAR